MHNDVPTCRTDGSAPTAARFAAYKRCHATVTRPVSELRTARAASVHRVSPAATRCDEPVHETLTDAGTGALALVPAWAGASTLPAAVTSARNGSRGACVGNAATGSDNAGACLTARAGAGAGLVTTTGRSAVSVPIARAIGWRAISTTPVANTIPTVHALGSCRVPTVRRRPSGFAGRACGRAHGWARTEAVWTAAVTT